ncbi:MAG: polysaccharide export protein [Mucilaginibacter sp.]|nr:polysaccharide export protein [Mucilaginibacter sp.]
MNKCNLGYTFLILGILLFFASCANKQYQMLFEKKRSISDSLFQPTKGNSTYYRIKPQDILQIRNLQNSKSIADLNPATAGSLQVVTTGGDTFQVEDDGTIALTGLGHVQVEGLTRFEAQKHIEDLYRKTFLKNPIIELKIINLKVTIFGEIKSPGAFSLTKDKTTLIELIGEAGGLTERANETNIKIIRGSEKIPKVTEIDLSDIESINDPRAVLQNGDIVYITENKRAIRNDKLQNFSTIYQPAILLFNTALIILTLIRR